MQFHEAIQMDSADWRPIIRAEHFATPLIRKGAAPTELGVRLGLLLRKVWPFVHCDRLILARSEYLAMRDEVTRMALGKEPAE